MVMFGPPSRAISCVGMTVTLDKDSSPPWGRVERQTGKLEIAGWRPLETSDLRRSAGFPRRELPTTWNAAASLATATSQLDLQQISDPIAIAGQIYFRVGYPFTRGLIMIMIWMESILGPPWRGGVHGCVE